MEQNKDDVVEVAKMMGWLRILYGKSPEEAKVRVYIPATLKHGVEVWYNKQDGFFEDKAPEEINFSSDWNLLIAAVSWIKRTIAMNNIIEMKCKGYDGIFYSLSGQPSMAITWAHIIRFAKWYNKNFGGIDEITTGL